MVAIFGILLFNLKTSMSIVQSIRNWYGHIEARNFAKLTPAERADLLAFDTAFKKRLWRNIALFIMIWLLMAVVSKLALGRIGWFGASMLSGLVLISLTLTLTGAWFGPSRFKIGVKSLAVFLGMAITGAVVGGIAAKLALSGDLSMVLEQFIPLAPQILIGGLVTGLVYAVLMVSIVQYRRTQLQRNNTDLARLAQQERMRRQLADARLKLMQAQVEPHFLFNTLASVQQLAETEGKAPEAAHLTAQLITFLRAGLASLREETTTLAREFKAIDAYLTIMKTRMQDRLTFELDLPDALVDIKMPPAMLISLVENAIKHGLEPNPEGGKLNVTARLENERLRLTVSDNGLGLGHGAAKAGGGVGLDNIRQRLRAIFANDARLIVAENEPHGFIAVIDIPLHEKTQKAQGFAHEPV
jgi:sensor histidine kinase YesM